MGFTKLHAQITRSSMWDEDYATRIVWVTLLAMADETGHVTATRRALRRVANVEPDELERALEVIEGPDPNSTSPDHEGRRALPVQGGWWLVNYAQYRDRESDAKRANRERQQRHRDRKKAERNARNVTRNATSHPSRNITLEAEAEAEAEGEAEGEQRRARAPKSPAARSTRRKPKPPPEKALAIAQYLYDAIRSHTPDFRANADPADVAKSLTTWAKAIDLAMRKDGATEAELKRAIDFAHRSPRPFWRSNLLSGKKLREHRERLLMQASEAQRGPPPRQERGQPLNITDEQIEAAIRLTGGPRR